MVRVLSLLALLAACSSPAMDPDLSLHDRFVLTALAEDDGTPVDYLWRWEYPVLVEYRGPERFRQDIVDHLEHLAEISGLWVKMDATHPTLLIEISERNTGYTCVVEFNRRERLLFPEVYIRSDKPDWYIRQCILQEITQAIGPGGDLDGIFGSRSDTVFASWQTANALTPQDIAVLRILFDDRLYSGMPRDEVLALLPDIVADVEAAQEAGR